MINSMYSRGILDIAEALERIGGDEELLYELWGIFIDETPKQTAAFKAAIETTDIVSIERLAHSLKSASANVGANSLKETALKIEITARDGNFCNVQTLYEEMEHKLMEVIKEIECLQSQNNTVKQKGEAEKC